MIRLIVSDIDGTLVPDSSDHIDPVYYDLIRELKKKGSVFLRMQRQTVSQYDEAFFTGC